MAGVHVWATLVAICILSSSVSAQLKQNYYASVCPNVESIVRGAVNAKFKQTFVTVPATLRLFFHDCFVSGCDASVIVASANGNTAEKDHPDNLSLAGDGFDTVIKAKKAVDAVSQCRNKVSCADILALATRDVIVLAGGPSYKVELGRLDGLVSTAASVEGNLPHPDFKLDKLNSMFASRGLNQADMIALSAAHTLGFSHCSKFSNRLYSFNSGNKVDPTLDPNYANQLKGMCPKNVDPTIAVNMDPTTPTKFDNVYYKNLQQKKGLFESDQALFTDARSRPTVNAWAGNATAFNQAFITAMTKLGRFGVKTGRNGNIRRDCGVFN
uniref:Peroxidase n=1 Tax=Kalanchoe fedtschenkoi TaxID=63787 RepID=A0A7N0T4Y8_KALFE